MGLHIWIFIGATSTVLTLATIYLARKLISVSRRARNHRAIVWLFSVIFLLLQIAGPLIYRTDPNPTVRPLVIQWLTYTTLGLFACVFLFTVATDIALFFVKRISEPPVDINRRTFLGVSFFSTTTVAIGSYQALSGPNIYNVEVPIKDLPQGLDGFRIAQISDLHVGPIIQKNYVQNVVDSVNQLQPNMIALTGDIIDGTPTDLQEHIEPLRQLQSTYGTFYTTGNHEGYWNASAWMEKFKSLGHHVLLNSNHTLQVNGETLVVAGIPDQSKHFGESTEASANLNQALAGVPFNAIKVLLAHQPVGYDESDKAGVHLQLSGHTHAGQFFPWNIFVSLVYRYYKGLNRHNNLWIYVNRGTGYWGPPLRFAVPSEITLLTLRRDTV